MLALQIAANIVLDMHLIIPKGQPLRRTQSCAMVGGSTVQYKMLCVSALLQGSARSSSADWALTAVL